MELLHHAAEEKNATPAQISLAWMLCKKDYILPILGTRKRNRLIENANATNVHLTYDEVMALDIALDKTEMSHVFDGSKLVKQG